MDFAANIAAYLTNEANTPQIRTDLAAYYAGESPAEHGYRFDELCRQADPELFNTTDFEAVAALGQALPDQVIAAVEAHSAQLSAKLVDLDEQVKFMPIWDSPDSIWMYPHSHLTSTFLYLRDEVPGVGGITASKLLACKYPELVPVRDIVSERVVGTDHTGPWGLMWRSVLTTDIRARLYELSADVVPDHVSLLRRAGVAIWMAGALHPGEELTAHGSFVNTQTINEPPQHVPLAD